MLLLWTAGVQILWAVREIVIERKHQDEDLGDHLIVPTIDKANFTWNNISVIVPEAEAYVSNGSQFFLSISTWYIGIAIGAAIGAILNKILSVKTIYVSAIHSNIWKKKLIPYDDF